MFAAMGLTTAKTAPGTKSKEEEYLEDEPQRPRMARPAAEVDTAVAHEADVMAIMGFGSFGVSKGTTSLKSSDDPSLHMRRNDSSARPDAAGARATMQSGPGNHDDAEPGASPRGDDRPVNRSEEDEPEAGPPRPASDAGGGENDQDLDGGGESIDERLGLPVTHELTIQHHSRLVSCVAIDPAGARFATGSHDCIIHLYDFNGMTQQKRSYRCSAPTIPLSACSTLCTHSLFLYDRTRYCAFQ